MTKNYSKNLQDITGVVVIDADGEERLCCLDDMQHTKYFTIGQIFNAVRVLNGKTTESYGKLWPRYSSEVEGETTSKDWKTLQSMFLNCDSDYDTVVEVCKQLKEEVPEIVPRATVQERLNMFKGNMFS